MLTGNFFLFFKIKYLRLKEGIKIIFRYYKSIKFALFDLMFHLLYLFENPYRTSRKYNEIKKESEIYSYGETLVTEMEKIAKAFSFKKEDVFLDLGSGRSYLSFWLTHFIGCRSICIEQIPSFINKAKILNFLFFNNRMKIVQGDFFYENLQEATLIYFYHYFLNEEKMLILLEKISKNKKVKVISIGYPLSDYSNEFEVEKSIPVDALIGKTYAFLNRIKNKSS